MSLAICQSQGTRLLSTINVQDGEQRFPHLPDPSERWTVSSFVAVLWYEIGWSGYVGAALLGAGRQPALISLPLGNVVLMSYEDQLG